MTRRAVFQPRYINGCIRVDRWYEQSLFQLDSACVILYNLIECGVTRPPWEKFACNDCMRERRERIMDVIKVKANSRTAAVAGAIAGVIREHKHAEVQAIGAGAVNQAIKALVLAKGYLAEDGIPVVCIPEFVDVDIDGKVRTAIKLVVEPK